MQTLFTLSFRRQMIEALSCHLLFFFVGLPLEFVTVHLAGPSSGRTQGYGPMGIDCTQDADLRGKLQVLCRYPPSPGKESKVSARGPQIFAPWQDSFVFVGCKLRTATCWPRSFLMPLPCSFGCQFSDTHRVCRTQKRFS